MVEELMRMKSIWLMLNMLTSRARIDYSTIERFDFARNYQRLSVALGQTVEGLQGDWSIN